MPGLVVPPDPIGNRPYRIVFVCTGNICRSPMAEVITRSLAASTELGDGTTLTDHLEVRSAGTGPWHEGEPMHELASATLVRGGYPDHPHVAHQFMPSQLGQIDLMVALDRRHQQTLRGLGADPGRLALLRAFDPAVGRRRRRPRPLLRGRRRLRRLPRHDRRRLHGPRRLPGGPLGVALGGLADTSHRPREVAGQRPTCPGFAPDRVT